MRTSIRQFILLGFRHIISLTYDGEGSRWNIFNPGKKDMNSRSVSQKYKLNKTRIYFHTSTSTPDDGLMSRKCIRILFNLCFCETDLSYLSYLYYIIGTLYFVFKSLKDHFQLFFCYLTVIFYKTWNNVTDSQLWRLFLSYFQYPYLPPPKSKNYY